MTITVEDRPLDEPPVNRVTVAAPGSGIIQSLLLYRNDPDGSRTEVREQPLAGFNSRTVDDPECAYEQAVTYGWTATYYDPTALVTVFNETWASVAAWTQLSGSWNVSGGKARCSTALGSKQMSRAVTLDKYRVTIGSLAITNPGDQAVVHMSVGAAASADTAVQIYLLPGGIAVLVKVAGVQIVFQATAIDETQPITVDFLEDSISVAGTGDSLNVPVSFAFDTVTLDETQSVANTVLFGAVKVESYPAPASLAETSDPVTLDVHDTWLVHPAAPGKSFKLQNVDPLEAGIRTFGDLSRPSRATLVDIMGSDLSVPITFGPRGGGQMSIAITTVTSAERLALDVVLADEVPLLVNVPPSWGADIEHGFYSFLTSLERRFVAWLSRQQSARMFEIPIVRVGSPIVDVENSGWSVGAVLAEFASINGTLPSVMDTFDTTADLLVNNRS